MFWLRQHHISQHYVSLDGQLACFIASNFFLAELSKYMFSDVLPS